MVVVEACVIGKRRLHAGHGIVTVTDTFISARQNEVLARGSRQVLTIFDRECERRENHLTSRINGNILACTPGPET